MRDNSRGRTLNKLRCHKSLQIRQVNVRRSGPTNDLTLAMTFEQKIVIVRIQEP